MLQEQKIKIYLPKRIARRMPKRVYQRQIYREVMNNEPVAEQDLQKVADFVPSKDSNKIP